MTKILEGKISIHKKGFGFIKDEEGTEYFVPKSNRADCLHGDTVSFFITEPPSSESPKAIAQVKDVIETAREFIVGLTKMDNGIKTLISDDPKIFERMVVRNLNNLPENFKILFKIQKVDRGVIYVEKIKEIGHRDSLGMDVKSLVASHGVEESFPIEASREASIIPPVVLDKEKEGRTDLTNETIITIDGAKAKDLDDAIRVEKLENGNYLLGVYIADVSHYVKLGGAIDKEALNRATSIYLADRVIPMLPENLSNGICSLNPKVDRLTLSCEMEINDKGEVVNSKIFKAVIKTTERMTYSDVNKIYQGDEELTEKYSNILELLNNARELAAILSKAKKTKGMLDFDIDESEIVTDEKGTAIDIVLRERGESEKLIEAFMVKANETTASTIEKMDLPSIYRTHGVPTLEKLTNFYSFARHFGEHFEAKQTDIKPKDVQQILNLYRDKPYFFSVTVQLLRSMEKAAYTKKNIGHFGLASDSYSHFTSPIRRYPDLIFHRIITDYIIKNEKEQALKWNRELDFLCQHTSDRERRAVDCERAVMAMKKAEWAIRNLEAEFENASIVSIIEFGMFVKLPNGVEGLIHVNDMYDDEYEYNESTFSLKGKATQREFKPGDRLNTFIKRASKQSGKIDIGLTEFKELTIENDRLRIEKANEEEAKRKEEAAKRREERKNSRFDDNSRGNNFQRSGGRSYGGNSDRSDRRDGRRSFGNDRRRDDRNSSDRRSFGNRDDRRDGRRSFGNDRRRDDRNSSDRRSFGNRDDRRDGRRSFGNRDDRRDGRRSFGNDRRRDDRNSSDRRSFGNDRRRDDRNSSDRRSFGNRDDRRGGRSSFGNDRNNSDRRSFGNDRRRDDRNGSDRRDGRRSFGNDRRRDDRNGSDRRGGRSFSNDRNKSNSSNHNFSK